MDGRYRVSLKNSDFALEIDFDKGTYQDASCFNYKIDSEEYEKVEIIYKSKIYKDFVELLHFCNERDNDIHTNKKYDEDLLVRVSGYIDENKDEEIDVKRIKEQHI